MYPVILSLGSLTIYSYGLFLALAFLAGTFVIWQESRKSNFDEEKILDFILVSVLGAFVFGRIAFVGFNWYLFSPDWKQIFLFWNIGGFHPIGVFLGSLIAGLIYLRKQRWPVFLSYDFLVLGLLISQVIERIGLFLAGGAMGKVTSLFLGVTFPGEAVKRLPVSLFESLYYAIVFIILYLLLQKSRASEKPQEGIITTIYLFVLGLGYLGASFLKEGDISSGIWSLTLVWPGLIILMGLVVLYLRQGKGFKINLGPIINKLSQPAKEEKVGLEKLVDSTKDLQIKESEKNGK